MDSSSSVHQPPKHSVGKKTANLLQTDLEIGNGVDGNEECDFEAWDTLDKGFKEAQSVLDQNRLLIQQVNENHQSKIPDNLVKNVALIQEINCNILKVSDVYSNLSMNFASFVRQRRVKNKNDKMGRRVDS